MEKLNDFGLIYEDIIIYNAALKVIRVMLHTFQMKEQPW